MTDDGGSDRSAWIGEALRRFEGPLLRYAGSITRRGDLARDVVQDAFLRLCKESPAELNGRLGPWLFAVCRNLAIDVRRKDERMQTLTQGSIAESSALSHDAESAIERHESGHEVLRLVGDLPDNQQEVIRLRFQGGLSYKDIAAVTGLSVGNVGFLLHTAIATLRTKMRA